MAIPPRKTPADARAADQATLALIERAVAGEPKAIREIVDTLTPTIHKHVMRALLRRRRTARNRDVGQEIADLAQGVFLALFAEGGRELRQWDPARGALATFIGLVTEREVASILRSRRRSPWTEEPTPDEDLESGDPTSGLELKIASKEMFEAIVARLRVELSDLGLEMFYLVLVEDRPTEDICTIMGMTPEAVYKWRSRLIQLIRKVGDEISSEREGERRTKRGTP